MPLSCKYRCLTSDLVQEANIPHNILVVDCGQRLFLFPNNFSIAKAEGKVPDDLLDTQVDPAAFEMAGHLILKRIEDYKAITQVNVDKYMHKIWLIWESGKLCHILPLKRNPYFPLLSRI